MTQPEGSPRTSLESPAAHWARVRPLVEAVLAVSAPARPAVLDQQCGGDERLRDDIVRMVRACERAESENYLVEPAAVAAALVADMQARLRADDDRAAADGGAGAMMATRRSNAFAGNERFVLVRQLGVGGMGVVYEAIDRLSGARVALKTLPFADPHALFEFKREFRSLAALVHPNLVSLYELISADNRWFFTMELVNGDDFLSWVRGDRHIPADSASAPVALTTVVDEQRLRSALGQLATGVAALHARGMLHRDLKPPNVLVRQDGRVAILDFGIALVLTESTQTDRHLGTLKYMSPEQLAGTPLTSASDWYAVGIILYEALTGRAPFAGAPARIFLAKSAGTFTPPSALVSGVPQDLDDLCVQLLGAEAALRPSGEEVVGRLISASVAPAGAFDTGRRPHRLFVGREAQLAALASALDATRAAACRTVFVHGLSGAGKSALIDRFLGEVRLDERVVLFSGRCDEQESVPFKAVDSVVDALTVWLRQRSAAELVRLLPADVAVLGRLFPVLERIGAIADAPRDGLAVRDPRELRQRAFRALRELLVRIGHMAPLLVVIDDLQWGDADSGELLAHILDGPTPPRMLFVAAYRSEYRETSRCLQVLASAQANRRDGGAITTLALPPLDDTEAQTLSRELLASGANEAVIARVATESGGNPFFIHELARYVRVHPRWADSLAGPFDLDRVLWSRIETLPAQAKELLEIIATAGKPIRNLHWRDASDRPAQDPHAMALLRYEHLVRSTGSAPTDEVETYHDRIRETVVARLMPAVRQRHHRRLALALAAHDDADQETVAVHFAEGGEPARAGAHYARAAELAERALAFDRAATLYERALELRPGEPSEHRRLLTSLGNALANAGRGRLAGQGFERAAALAEPDDRLDLQRMAATQYAISGHIDEGRALFMRVLHGVGLSSPESSVVILAQLLGRRARLRLRGLHFVERAECDIPPKLLRRIDVLRAVSTALGAVEVVRVAGFQTQALLLALDAGEPRRLALALAWEAVLTATGGTRTATRSGDMLELARRLAERVESPHALGTMDFAAGWVAFLHGRFPDAIRACALAEPVFRDQCTGVWWELSTTRTMLAWARSHCGDHVELGANLRTWEPEARARGDHFLVTNLLAFPMPYERLVADDVVGAERCLEEALALWPYRGFHIQHVSVLFSRALLLLYRGDGARACAEVTSQWPAMVRSLQTQNQVTRVMLRDVRARGALAAAAAGIDRERHIARAARDLHAIARERGAWTAGYADRLRAGLALVRGDAGSAARALRTAVLALDGAGLVLQASVARRQLGMLVAGDDGRQLIADADTRMRTRGVVNITAMSRMLGAGLA